MTNELHQEIAQIEEEKLEIKAKFEELEQAASVLRKNGLESAAMDAEEKVRDLYIEYNHLCDCIRAAQKSIRSQYEYEKKMRGYRAENEGVEAYWEATETKTFQAHCPYKAKYLQKAWLKGYRDTCAIYGELAKPTMAA